jgi:hypothetical protein
MSKSASLKRPREESGGDPDSSVSKRTNLSPTHLLSLSDDVLLIIFGHLATPGETALTGLLLLLWTPSLRSRLALVRPHEVGPSPWVLS